MGFLNVKTDDIIEIFRIFYNARNAFMNPGFGSAQGRRDRINSSAFSTSIPCVFIKYAAIIVGDLDTVEC